MFMTKNGIKHDDDKYTQLDLKGRIDYLKTNSNYPKQSNEHNALNDAHFCYSLYKFLQTIN